MKRNPPPQTQIVPRYLTFEQAAAYMSMSVPSLRWHVRQGRLPIIKIGHSRRFDRLDIDAMMDSSRWDQPGFRAARLRRA